VSIRSFLEPHRLWTLTRSFKAEYNSNMSIDPSELKTFAVFANEHSGDALSLEDALRLFRQSKSKTDKTSSNNGTSNDGTAPSLGEDLVRLRNQFIDSGGELSTVDEINHEVLTGRKEL